MNDILLLKIQNELIPEINTLQNKKHFLKEAEKKLPLFYLSQENLLSLYFTDDIALDIHLEESYYDIRIPDNISLSVAEQEETILSEFDSLARDIKKEIELYKDIAEEKNIAIDLSIENESAEEDTEEDIIENVKEEEITEQKEPEEKKERNKFNRTGRKTNQTYHEEMLYDHHSPVQSDYDYNSVSGYQHAFYEEQNYQDNNDMKQPENYSYPDYNQSVNEEQSYLNNDSVVQSDYPYKTFNYFENEPSSEINPSFYEKQTTQNNTEFPDLEHCNFHEIKSNVSYYDSVTEVENPVEILTTDYVNSSVVYKETAQNESSFINVAQTNSQNTEHHSIYSDSVEYKKEPESTNIILKNKEQAKFVNSDYDRQKDEKDKPEKDEKPDEKDKTESQKQEEIKKETEQELKGIYTEIQKGHLANEQFTEQATSTVVNAAQASINKMGEADNDMIQKGYEVDAAMIGTAASMIDSVTVEGAIRDIIFISDEIGKASAMFHDLCTDGSVSTELLRLDKKELKEKLQELGTLKAEEISLICHHQEEILGKISVRDDLLNLHENGIINLSEKELNYLQKEFLSDNIKNDCYQNLMNKILANSGMEELKNTGKMTIKDFNKSITDIKGDANFVKKDFCTSKESILFALKEKKNFSLLRKLQKNRTKDRKKILQNLKRLYKQLNGPNDENMSIDAFHKLKQNRRRFMRTSAILLRTTKYTLKTLAFITTIPGRFYAMCHHQDWGLKTIKVRTKNGKIKTKIVKNPYQSVYVKANRYKQQKMDEMKNNIQKYSQKQAKKMRDKYKNSAIGKFNQRVAGVVLNPLRQTARNIYTRFQSSLVGRTAHYIGRAVGGVFRVFRGITSFIRTITTAIRALITTCIVAVIALFLLWIIGLFVTDALADFFDMSQDVYESTVLLDEEHMQEFINKMEKREQERYVDALDLALNPINNDMNDVYGGYEITHYGIHSFGKEVITNKALGSFVGKNKKYTINEKKYNYLGNQNADGYMIYYIDSEGHEIGDETTNIKDIISMASIMTSNLYIDEEETNVVYDLAEQLYDKMNPEIHVVQSDIYYCDTGCHYYPESNSNGTSGMTYYCHDSSVYDKYNELKSQGVYFFSDLAPQTSSGCQSKKICDGHEEVDAETGAVITTTCDGSDCDNYHTEYYCNGHSAVHTCAGHKDVNIYVTLLTYKDVIAHPDGNIPYVVPDAHGNKTTYSTNVVFDYNDDNVKEWISEGGWTRKSMQESLESKVNQDWYELYHVTIAGRVYDVQ